MSWKPGCSECRARDARMTAARCPICNAPTGTHYPAAHGHDAWSADPAERVRLLLEADLDAMREAVAA